MSFSIHSITKPTSFNLNSHEDPGYLFKILILTLESPFYYSYTKAVHVYASMSTFVVLTRTTKPSWKTILSFRYSVILKHPKRKEVILSPLYLSNTEKWMLCPNVNGGGGK